MSLTIFKLGRTFSFSVVVVVVVVVVLLFFVLKKRRSSSTKYNLLSCFCAICSRFYGCINDNFHILFVWVDALRPRLTAQFSYEHEQIVFIRAQDIDCGTGIRNIMYTQF